MEDITTLTTAATAAATAASAAQVAAQVAAEAVTVARDVAMRAAETATKVAELAAKTQESVLLFGQDLAYIKIDIAEIKEKLDSRYVTKEEYKVVKAIVYGMCGSILLAFVGGIVSMLFKTR